MIIFAAAIIYILLVVILATREREIEISEFELRRRVELGDRRASKMLLKKQLIPAWNRLVSGLAVILAVIFTVLVAQSVDLWRGMAVSLLMIGLSLVLAKNNFIKKPILKNLHRYSHKFYKLFEILGRRLQAKIIKFGKTKSSTNVIYSTDELMEVLRKSPEIMSDEQIEWLKKLIRLNKTVAEIMTKSDDLTILAEKDLLTPIVINELYQTGQDFFAVIDQKTKRVVGVLDLAKVTDLTNKTSQIAKNVMDRDFVTLDQNLTSLSAFSQLIESLHSFAVIEDGGELVGVINLKDFLK